jgi:hypothetical protein
MAAALRLLAPRCGESTPPHPLCAWPEYRHFYTDGVSPSVNRAFGLGVHLVWDPSGSVTLDGRRYEVRLGGDPELLGARVWVNLAQTTLELFDLHLGQRYYWQVIERRRGRVTAESEVSWFETHPQPPRWLSAHRLVNLRDAGGWPAAEGKRVRQGMVYRSAEINSHHRLVPAERRYLLDTLGIRTDLDLRGAEEKPAPALDRKRVIYINAPVDAYDHITLDWSRAGYCRAFAALAQAQTYPVLVHCWAGADRTGTLVFLLNGLLGVSLPDLIHDYEATSLSGVGRRLATSLDFQKMLVVLRDYAPAGAPLAEQIAGYLSSIGVTLAEMDQLRDLLLE